MNYWILFSCLILFLSCQNDIPFNSEKWNEKGIDWQLSDTREKMISDLISSDTLLGMNSDEIIKLLGEPEFEKEKSLEYLIREKYSWNIDPDYIKYLIIEMNEKDITKNIYIRK